MSVRLCAASEDPVAQPRPAPAKSFAELLLPKRSFFEPDAHRIDDRAVFAWYLTCCGAFGGSAAAGSATEPNPGWPASPRPAEAGVEQYRRVILLAQAAGYDGFALDEFASGPSLTAADKANIAAIFEAARRLDNGFRLYFVFDQTGHDARDYRDLLVAYAHHPSYFRYRGLPVAAGYAPGRVAATPDASAQWWATRVIRPASVLLRTPIFWLPVSAGAGAEHCTPPTASWRAGGARALAAWQIQTAPIGGGLACQERYAEHTHAAGLTWVGSYSWHYWAGSVRVLPGEGSRDDADQPSASFEHGGGMGLALSWASLIERQAPAWITMLTANDYQESYGETVDDYQHYRVKPGNGTARYTPPGWYQDQSGMADLNRYYLQWYRSGRMPVIATDALFASYRIMPEAYRVPRQNRFTAAIGDGRAASGDVLTVSAIETGYVVPGEMLHAAGLEGLTIVEQIDGAPFGVGHYRVDGARNVAARPATTNYRPLPPRFERGGEPADPIYVTAAVAREGAVFAAAHDGQPYRHASIDGSPAGFPASLTPGLHQIRIAPFVPGLPSFTLTRPAGLAVRLAGRPIVAGGPVYDFFPATAFGYGPRRIGGK